MFINDFISGFLDQPLQVGPVDTTFEGVLVFGLLAVGVLYAYSWFKGKYDKK